MAHKNLIPDTLDASTLLVSKVQSIDDIDRYYLADETDIVMALLSQTKTESEADKRIHRSATALVNATRTKSKQSSGLDAFMDYYDLSSNEGIVLMCLAEALLRIPDKHTIDDLIQDKLSAGNWEKHLGESGSLLTNASTWALMLTGKLMHPDTSKPHHFKQHLTKLFVRLEEPILRAAMKSAMRIMAREFVMGRNIHAAVQRTQENNKQIYRYSFDMLGEAALTKKEADRYQTAYSDAIRVIAEHAQTTTDLQDRPSISVKLSALCPRYEYTQAQRAILELSQRLLVLAGQAKKAGIYLTIDAEESERLTLSLKVFENTYQSSELEGWGGLGLAVQAYQKRALPVLIWLNHLSSLKKKIIPVRLVKGAYWDSEIKQAQELGLSSYPVFTRKSNTDVSYLACASYMFAACRYIYPQFATHNAHTLAYIHEHAKSSPYEFQRLHGMGEALYNEIVPPSKWGRPCRVYAPVGAHEDVLPYLVRRLLENGANTSFINQLTQKESSVDEMISNPVQHTKTRHKNIPHPKIPLPGELFSPNRQNSHGINFADKHERDLILNRIANSMQMEYSATSIIEGVKIPGVKHPATNPSTAKTVGHIDYIPQQAIITAIDVNHAAWPCWNATPAQERARLLETAADLFEQQQEKLIALCVLEAGKTIRDSHAEIREAIDFLRYYANECKNHFTAKLSLPGPTGEKNELRLQGRGVFMCISPWNFPVAIYTGQIAAALAAGNTVIAKPAEQTSLTAYLATQLLYAAGIPENTLSLLLGEGALIADTALDDPRIVGVAVTGSTKTARSINQKLAMRAGPIATLIAETGGQNAMIVDSSALPEQVVRDVMLSAFNSAGQRCSALRVLYLQTDIADRVLTLLIGQMDELNINIPTNFNADLGPVIDRQAQKKLIEHIDTFDRKGKVLHQTRIPESLKDAYFVAPTIIELNSINQLKEENFGPILHVIPYQAKNLHKVVNDINHCGYGLTLGIHSRIEQRYEKIQEQMQVGNIYINRNMIGAVVGVQPFGGCKLSGTGPKAGGPHYLFRFASEQTSSVNTSAVGGNASLLSLS